MKKLTKISQIYLKNYLMVEKAKLELVKSDDPLQTGLEIFARPPGKKLSNISLLSRVKKH